MSFTSRLLCMALALPVFAAGHKVYALDITEPVAGPVDTGTTGGALDENGDHASAGVGGVSVDGTPGAPGAVFVIDHGDARDVVIDGPVTVNDRSDDELVDFDANNAIGVLVGNGAAVTGTDSFDLVALDEPEDRALIGASFAAGNRYFALEVGLRGEFGGDTEVVSGSASLRVNF